MNTFSLDIRLFLKTVLVVNFFTIWIYKVKEIYSEFSNNTSLMNTPVLYLIEVFVIVYWTSLRDSIWVHYVKVIWWWCTPGIVLFRAEAEGHTWHN